MGGVPLEVDEPNPAMTDGSQSTALDESNDSQSNHASGPSIAGQPLQGLKENCGVPGVHIRLVPDVGNMEEYEALFISGPLKGETVSSKTTTMSQAKWDQLQHCKTQWQCPGPDMNSKEVKHHHKVSAVCKLLELTMEAKLAQHERLSDNIHP